MKELKFKKCATCKKTFSYPTIFANSDQAFTNCMDCLGDNYDYDDIDNEVMRV